MKVIGKYRVPFAVKGGGHATSPGFSSTTGIQISMCRFNKIEVKKDTSDFLTERDAKHSLVRVGAGCLFDEVYRAVVPHGLNIVGGSSIGGVGIGGWLLGGGYSLKTNQYGMGIDNIIRVQIVLPNGTSREVSVLSEGEDKELFWAVKGGRDNFGIVTEFTIRAHTQVKPIFGALLTYELEEHEEAKIAIEKFARQEDPKASIVAAFRHFNRSGTVQSKLTVQCFYDGPIPRTRPFAEFMKIEHKTDSGGGDTVGHESLATSAPIIRTLGATISDQHSTKGMTRPTSSQSQPEEPSLGLQEYHSYEGFEEAFSLLDEKVEQELSLFDEKVEQELSLFKEKLEQEFSALSDKLDRQIIREIQTGNINSGSNNAGSNVGPGPIKLENLAPQAPERIKRSMAGVGENPRGRWGNVMVDVYTKPIIDEIARQSSKASRQMLNHGGKRVVIDIWPFTKSMFDHSTPSAWPHDSGSRNGHIVAYFIWEDPKNDQFWIKVMEDALSAIKAKISAARGDGADPLPVYSNTALGSTKVEDIYGENLDELRRLRKKFDPELVMDLARGFKIPHPPAEATADKDSE
ncbi:hypothetical protein HYDPIDRAFT_109865 [Hydnomerulius pinastri MD-312]|nr:hypothetical protein HYDPIDRAFT_109865 [Hydnomerulius pinastri MD-312]